MGEAVHQVVRELSPERVVPTELATAQDSVFPKRVEVGANLVDGAHGPTHVRRDVIAHTRANAKARSARDELGDRQVTVGKRRVRMTVHGTPGAAVLGQFAAVTGWNHDERAACPGACAPCRAAV